MSRSARKEIEPDLGILAGRVLLSVQREVVETLAAQGHERIRPKHGAVLAYLDAEGSRATELAQRSGQHKQVIGTLVDELIDLGYVRREPDPDDRRAKLIVPTELGLDQMNRSDELLALIERRLAAVVGEQAYADFKHTFQEIATLRQQAGQGG
ncbi:MarR family transcriptional regulator [Streptomyces sp. WMMC500]|uniref:MarR family winged helix-turn-helix transcriptional regulator n=1 Tax=Streptomyces sp. WMMC500 TaxID=3015154 RepID=UPI00248B3BFE|nr:MarR family transcriptional regulator [Streptomyces sp. WMMC500]WBB59656.1 MarR family transcriptional regulator [Streptomyces sp. WMMC500]